MFEETLNKQRKEQFAPTEHELPTTVQLLQNAGHLKITPYSYEGKVAVKIEAKELIYAPQLLEFLQRCHIPCCIKAINGSDILHPTGVILYDDQVVEGKIIKLSINCEPDCSGNITEVVVKIYNFPAY